MFKGVKRTLELRRSLESIYEGIYSLTSVMEDNQATDSLKMDIVLACLYHQFIIANFIPLNMHTTLNKADMNRKPYGGETLIKLLLPIIGFQF